jgi:hypothetical protein
MSARTRLGVVVPAAVLLVAALFLMQRRANARSVIVVAMEPAIEQTRALGTTQDSTLAVRFLAGARGTSPLLCALAGQALHGHGWFGSHLDTEVLWGRDAGVRELVRWADDDDSRDAAAIAPLLAALAEPDPCASRLAAQLLGHARVPRATEGLLAALRAASPATRAAAALGLGYTENPAAVDPLVAALGDADATVRATAAWSLGEIEQRRAVAPLIAALRDADAMVRRSAAHALGNIEDPSAIPALSDLLRGDRDASVRAAAARALGEIAG